MGYGGRGHRATGPSSSFLLLIHSLCDGQRPDRTEVASVDDDKACELVSGVDLVIVVDIDDEDKDICASPPAAATRHHHRQQRLDGGGVESISVMMAPDTTIADRTSGTGRLASSLHPNPAHRHSGATVAGRTTLRPCAPPPVREQRARRKEREKQKEKSGKESRC
uniref:Uncharacterized protein n=1 Tax=Oryza rufipogon TaxID=4529 RepID=A0A0E0RJE2_ORYRU